MQREQEDKRAKEERGNGEKQSFSLSSSFNQSTNKSLKFIIYNLNLNLI